MPERVWAVGEYRDDRPCLVLDGDEWVAGYFERGRFTEKFRETDTGTAVSRFGMWAWAILESSEVYPKLSQNPGMSARCIVMPFTHFADFQK